MKKKILCCIVAVAGVLMLSATEGFAFSGYGNDVNSTCSPAAPYSGDCNLCHTGSKGAPTPAKDAYSAGGTTLTDFFCPPTPACTDNDGDTFAANGGDCGPVDCNDNDAAINPGAAENCTDNFDNDCDGLIDSADSNAVGCPAPCTDNDGDGYAIEGGTCGPVDCNDNDAAINPNAVDIPNNGIDEDCFGADSVDPTRIDNDGDGYTPDQGDCKDNNPAINPGAVDVPNNGIDENCDGLDSVDGRIVDNDGDGFTPATGDCDDTDSAINPEAVEICTDGIDNNCDGLVDTQDPEAINCPLNCTDNDGDTYATEGGDCGQVDCDDLDPNTNPGAEEVCGDAIDNDCDGLTDEGCDPTCPDNDGDGYLDASCGGNDCDDTAAHINPGSAEICGNSVDENCNGVSDDVCLTCPDGGVLLIKEMEYSQGDAELKVKGRANVDNTITIANADTGEILADEIKVRGGKWRVKIKDLAQAPERMRVISSNGCFVDQEIEVNNKDHEDDKESDGHEDRKSRRSHD